MNEKIKELLTKPRMWDGDIKDNRQSMKYLYTGFISDFCNKDFTIIEIGSYSGGSTELFANTCKMVYSIDPYMTLEKKDIMTFCQCGSTLEAGMENTRIAEEYYDIMIKNYENIKKITLLGIEAVNMFNDETIDIVYFDGSKKYESLVDEIKAYYSKIKIGGIIAGHDYYENAKLAINGVLGIPLKVYKDTSWAFIKQTKEIVKREGEADIENNLEGRNVL